MAIRVPSLVKVGLTVQTNPKKITVKCIVCKTLFKRRGNCGFGVCKKCYPAWKLAQKSDRTVRLRVPPGELERATSEVE